jgi:hypothetical protein
MDQSIPPIARRNPWIFIVFFVIKGHRAALLCTDCSAVLWAGLWGLEKEDGYFLDGIR